MANANISQPIMSAITPIYFDVFAFGMISAYFVVYVRNKVKCIDKLKLCMTIISALSIFSAFGYMCWLRKISFPNGVAGDVYFRFLYRGIFSVLIALFLFTACFSYGFWEKKICQIWKWIRWPTARLQAWITALFLEKLLQQNGYTSDNSKHGLKSALKDYEAVFHSGAPKWLDLVWPSIGVSLLHLAFIV